MALEQSWTDIRPQGPTSKDNIQNIISSVTRAQRHIKDDRVPAFPPVTSPSTPSLSIKHGLHTGQYHQEARSWSGTLDCLPSRPSAPSDHHIYKDQATSDKRQETSDKRQETTTSDKQFTRRQIPQFTMKPTSPLSLLLFIRLATPAPIAIPHRILTSSSSCTGSFDTFREILVNVATPPTNPTNPLFPAPQLASDSLDILIDDRPTAPIRVSPSTALKSEWPPTSAFLLSLTNPTQTSQDEVDGVIPALPSRPTNDLPALRKKDARRYWATRNSRRDKNVHSNLHIAGRITKMSCRNVDNEGVSESYTVRIRTSHVIREYSDVLVVAIVLLFLVIVVGVEAVEKCGSVQWIFSRSTRKRRGAIFLADDEKPSVVVASPTYPKPTGPSDYKFGSEYGKAS
ncbi:hypothetical protein BJ875DRAFT_510668 [Amylocarpus encephaloides]|uniref:Uncharacterized protein n=1 Tax=Amylocarpus encephaloides TaxID=45428 RepID=A0A9P7YI45_9HELO|nr:hypothetical protein BJ875DRAFT_510668 [Amylocarpus encephaloides]